MFNCLFISFIFGLFDEHTLFRILIGFTGIGYRPFYLILINIINTFLTTISAVNNFYGRNFVKDCHGTTTKTTATTGVVTICHFLYHYFKNKLKMLVLAIYTRRVFLAWVNFGRVILFYYWICGLVLVIEIK